MTLLDLINRTPIPQPWAEGDHIPWDDPEFSARMLKEHLSQEHDAASRRSATIDGHVQWIHSDLLCCKPAHILDLGCGPGLYTSRLARLGHTCTGIDFGPASLDYARAAAMQEGLACEYRLGDLRSADFGTGYQLVMQIFGEINVFTPANAARILQKACGALEKGGLLLLEVHSEDAVRRMAAAPTSWYSARAGLFSAHPHLCLEENFWDEPAQVATRRFAIIDAQGEQSAQVTRYAMSTHAYSDSGYQDLIAQSGFEDIHFYPVLAGKADEPRSDFFAITARKPV
jgi:SAM-dependent methyltransferase